MNNKLFRTVEFWKEAITTLPENSFFELLRIVFGKIKTPYNKQILINDLEKFLLRKDIQKNIAAYIGRNDANIICAIAALDEPAMDELTAFFSDPANIALLQDQIVNLEERFIIYRFTEKGKSRLALNPVLKPVLLPHTVNTQMLFPSLPQDEPADCAADREKIILDDRIIAAFFSFVFQTRILCRPDGGISKKAISAAKNLFPNLPIEAVVSCMQILGLLSTGEDRLSVDHQRISAFGKLSRRERLEYFSAGILTNNSATGELSPWLYQMTVRNNAKFIHHLCDMLDPNRLYPKESLYKSIYFIKHNNENIDSDKLVEAMEKTGMLVLCSDKYRHASQFPEPSAGSAVIAMDSAFTMLVYPEIAFNDAISLAWFTTVIETGLTVRLEIGRDSVVNAYNQGMSAQDIIELLRRLSNNRIEENLIFSLHDWEKSYREVTMQKGLVLTLSPERQYLAKTRSLASLIVQTLAPGIYMLHESSAEKAAEALQRAGVAIIARRKETDLGDVSSFRYSSFFSSLGAAELAAPEAPDAGEPPPPAASEAEADSASALMYDFHSILNKTRPEGEDRDELAVRIDRRLILCESQLKDAVLRYEKLEARGLDYAGKAMIAKQGITMQATIEIAWSGRQKKERFFGIPKALEKTGGENYLVVSPLSNPDDTVRIPLGKISLLRRVKKSIFEN